MANRKQKVSEQTGLIQKFKVERLEPSSRGIDHSECRYFVLDPQHDPVALAALGYYSRLAQKAGQDKLHQDITAWIQQIADEQAADASHDN